MFTTLTVQAEAELAEVLQVELAELGFDMFLETADGFEASAESVGIDEEAARALLDQYGVQTFQFASVEKQNWNEEWEKNYHPVYVREDCVIRADFHQLDKSYAYELVINPKMSFGTGHHETTTLMSLVVLELALEGKTVLDAGCGTGILGILAAKRGATVVDVCDIEDWSVENAVENALRNEVQFGQAFCGKATEISGTALYDVLLANIHLSVILEELPVYAALTKPQGLIAVSGFYVQDIPAITARAEAHGLVLRHQNHIRHWATLLFEKID